MEQFDYVMGWAKRLAADSNQAGLEDLIKIVLRPVQAERMRVAFTRAAHQAPECLWWIHSMGGLWDLQGPDGTWLSYALSQLRRPVDMSEMVSFSRDVLLPTPWSDSSIKNSLGTIGHRRINGPFKSDVNHQVTLMLPCRIAWVGGGNHSIAQGILSGEGCLKPTDVLDVSAVVAAVRYDGECWVCSSTGARLQGPIYPEFGWAWEISRLILELSISS